MVPERDETHDLLDSRLLHLSYLLTFFRSHTRHRPESRAWRTVLVLYVTAAIVFVPSAFQKRLERRHADADRNTTIPVYLIVRNEQFPEGGGKWYLIVREVTVCFNF